MDAGAMTHDEIWDDSALVDSWNEALREYKKYHSVHARGGLEDGELDLPDALQPDAKTETSGGVEPEGEAGAEARDGLETITGGEGTGAGTQPRQVKDEATADGQARQASMSSFAPQTVLGTVQDDGLKALLMSWYYAGYYTGLHEGRQRHSGN